MGAEPGGRSRRRGPRALGALRACAFGAAGLLLAGCASMPDHGEVRPVEASQGVDSQVRVFGVPPADKASPQEIVDGFLEAMTSDDPQLQTARKYLTDEAAKNWKPGAAVTVLSAGLDRFSVQGEKDPAAPRFKITGKMLATVDERSAYQPETGDRRYEEFLQLTQKDNQWRIATPPSSLVLSESDFQRIYRPVNKYYFAGSTLVADPVYVRQRSDPDSRMDPTTQTVTSLLNGPSKWLGPVVASSFPTGTELREGTKSLSVDGQNTLRVPLSKQVDDTPEPLCQRMATQILYTVKDLTGSRVDRVDLLRSDGTTLCQVTEVAAATIANRPPSPNHQYYVDAENRLQRLQLDPNREEQQDPPTPVPGPLSGNPGFKVGSAAVTYDEKRAAVVSEDGHGLYVVNLTTAGAMPQPLLTGKGAKPNGLATPTWDAAGDLWVADPDPQDPTLWRIPHGTGAPERVEVSGLAGGRITGVKASPDGVRIALVVAKESRKSLYTGRIERPDGKGDASAVSVRELRPAAPQLADVTAMSWAPRGRLLVVGRESGMVVQARYMLADGSMVGAGLPGATGLVAVAASEDEKKPVVAESLEDGIVWLPPGAQWRTVVAGGRAPIYPG
ncbi:LpqB family beta-propeller domain-containing protein [Streptomyces sp. NPDC002812]|uniref:LpqB family beta-propeller domain-containing protein n=1 Tax=unclassified Streptomyces TaxID=2593676 RepID=UPI00202EDD4C|nr:MULTISPECIES: LpqB family beta-propeller domain-containing protein [unclassified Streptomyces]MCM1975408.1 LpqB family beta-propeller domain-containing protein [Streptomyces sp. G1]MCX5126090.1 LpqB family beta-propeller domain-containing protein [Streptomyces sp. NBC_00347]MCX5298111.1 LpqB family beta-propeller domain-containing protein [Streptomyces sp. NBC_00193]